MAKGDDSRVRNAINSENARQLQLDENLRSGVIDPQHSYFHDQNVRANQSDAQDYGYLMGGYKNFAETGGYSDADLGNIRSRALSPTRAVYANAMRNVDRQRSLQGGYSPGYNTLMGRMAREQSQGLSDAATNAEAMIAQMVQQGKLAGLQGGTGLYGTTPARSNMFGNQVMRATDQYLDLNRMDLQRALGVLQNRNAAAGIKGPWQQGFDNVLNAGKTAAGVIGSF